MKFQNNGRDKTLTTYVLSPNKASCKGMVTFSLDLAKGISWEPTNKLVYWQGYGLLSTNSQLDPIPDNNIYINHWT